MVSYDKLKKLMEGIEADVALSDGGNKSAQRRVRQAMQDIKKAAQEVRVESMEMTKKDKE